MASSANKKLINAELRKNNYRLRDIIRKSKGDAEKIICDVVDCENDSKRSISTKKLRKALPDLKLKTEASHAHLCREHYRELKKSTKKDRTLETLTWK